MVMVSCVKTAEPMAMPFGVKTLVYPRIYVLEGVQIRMGRVTCEGVSTA